MHYWASQWCQIVTTLDIKFINWFMYLSICIFFGHSSSKCTQMIFTYFQRWEYCVACVSVLRLWTQYFWVSWLGLPVGREILAYTWRLTCDGHLPLGMTFYRLNDSSTIKIIRSWRPSGDHFVFYKRAGLFGKRSDDWTLWIMYSWEHYEMCGVPLMYMINI